MITGAIVAGVFKALAMKAAEKVTEKSAEKAFENRSAILEKVRGLLVGEELTVLNLLEEFPENTDIQNKVAEKLTPRLEANPVVAEELKALLEKLNDSGITILNEEITKSEVKNKVKKAKDSEAPVDITNKKITEQSKVENDIEIS